MRIIIARSRRLMLSPHRHVVFGHSLELAGAMVAAQYDILAGALAGVGALVLIVVALVCHGD